MKKKMIIALMVLLAVSVLISGIVTAENSPMSQNQKMVDDTRSADDMNGIRIITREQREAEQQKIKEQLLNGDTTGISLVSTEPFTEEDKALLDKEYERMSEEEKQRQAIFTEGVEIVERYQPGSLDKDAGQLDNVDRNVLSTMVDVLSKYKLDSQEEKILKCCLAEKFCIILGSDPLYDTIVNLLDDK